MASFDSSKTMNVSRLLMSFLIWEVTRIISDSMQCAGFKTKFDSDDGLAEFAAIFFDSDHECRKKGFATPQHYFEVLMATDPLIEVPDAASKFL